MAFSEQFATFKIRPWWLWRHNRQSHGGQKASTRCWLWHCLVAGASGGRAVRCITLATHICDANCCARFCAPRLTCRNHCNYCEKYSFVCFKTTIYIMPFYVLNNNLAPLVCLGCRTLSKLRFFPHVKRYPQPVAETLAVIAGIQ